VEIQERARRRDAESDVRLRRQRFGDHDESVAGYWPRRRQVTITASGVSPKAVTINAGEVVMFVNSDTRNHQMDSNPHPEHTDCPGINAVDVLAAGQSRNTANLTTPRTCGYHDHGDSSNANLMGTITIR
jgi:plastocyanin